jgi:NADH:ubiquinone oxidoreductase subunit F (NADH-binding)
MTRLAERDAMTYDGPALFTAGVARLLSDQRRPFTTRSHGWLVDAARSVGLLGRGGAAFPVATKLSSVGRGAQVVVNGCEGEPASWKDRALMSHYPGLVVDGALLVGHALNSRAITIAVSDLGSAIALGNAADERGVRDRVQIVRTDNGFIGGEAAALVNALNGRPPVPNGKRVLPSERGVEDQPTYLSNVETFAQLALLGSLGPQEYAAVGCVSEPGTTLVTVHDPRGGSAVVEIPHGTPVDSLVGMSKRSLLIGGYHGTWIPADSTRGDLTVDRGALRARGIGWGAGVVAALPDDTCELGEIARVAAWLARQSAGQCGPCVFGLAAIADDLVELTRGYRVDVNRLRRRLGIVDGRGACAHPSGAVRFIASGLLTYAAELHRHEHGRGCGRYVRGVLPLGPASNGGTR